MSSWGGNHIQHLGDGIHFGFLEDLTAGIFGDITRKSMLFFGLFIQAGSVVSNILTAKRREFTFFPLSF